MTVRVLILVSRLRAWPRPGNGKRFELQELDCTPRQDFVALQLERIDSCKHLGSLNDIETLTVCKSWIGSGVLTLPFVMMKVVRPPFTESVIKSSLLVPTRTCAFIAHCVHFLRTKLRITSIKTYKLVQKLATTEPHSQFLYANLALRGFKSRM